MDSDLIVSEFWLAEDRIYGRGGTSTKPFIFYFSLMIRVDVYETNSCRALLIIVLVKPNLYSAMCLAIVQFSNPFTLTEFIWPPGLGSSTRL